jgi:hypothetical protein
VQVGQVQPIVPSGSRRGGVVSIDHPQELPLGGVLDGRQTAKTVARRSTSRSRPAGPAMGGGR